MPRERERETEFNQWSRALSQDRRNILSGMTKLSREG
jgi:hypothetical protein